MNLTRARKQARNIICTGSSVRYKSSDVSLICGRLRFGNKAIKPERHHLDIGIAEHLETVWQERRHAFECSRPSPL